MQQRPVMFYDGDCPLCAKEVRHYRQLDRAGAVEWVDIAREPQRLEALGVSRAAGMRRLHALDRQGRLVSGVPAFAAVWDGLPGYRYLARVIRALGLVGPLDRVYGRFARWRYQRRCRDGLCALPGGDG